MRLSHLALASTLLAHAAVAQTTTSGTAAINGTRLYYELRGSGPTLVLLQGANLPFGMWDAQFAEYAKHYRVLRYDVRGFGRSAPMRAPFTHHDDLLALLRQLKIERASLVGLSLGGRIAIDFTLLHPEMVESLVLVGPGLSGFKWSSVREPWLDAVNRAYDRKDSVAMAMAWLTSGYMRPAMRDSALARRLRALAGQNASFWMQTDSERTLDPPAVGRLASIHAPTLLILGSRDVPDIARIVNTLRKSIAKSRRVVIPDVGHVAPLEKPRAFDDAVLGFLRDVYASAATRSRE